MTNTAEQPVATQTLPINFTINVSANEADPEKNDFKCKVVIDFAPPFNGGNSPATSSFNANTIHSIMTFISERVLKKVVEAVYYDRDVATYDQAKAEYSPTNGLKLPPKYKEAMNIYNERREKKKGDDDTTHLDIKERKSKTRVKEDDDDEDCIECIVNKFLKTKDRPVWSKEKNVTRITFEQMSPPSLTVETRTVVNGDKKPK